MQDDSQFNKTNESTTSLVTSAYHESGTFSTAGEQHSASWRIDPATAGQTTRAKVTSDTNESSSGTYSIDLIDSTSNSGSSTTGTVTELSERQGHRQSGNLTTQLSITTTNGAAGQNPDGYDSVKKPFSQSESQSASSQTSATFTDRSYSLKSTVGLVTTQNEETEYTESGSTQYSTTGNSDVKIVDRSVAGTRTDHLSHVTRGTSGTIEFSSFSEVITETVGATQIHKSTTDLSSSTDHGTRTSNESAASNSTAVTHPTDSTTLKVEVNEHSSVQTTAQYVELTETSVVSIDGHQESHKVLDYGEQGQRTTAGSVATYRTSVEVTRVYDTSLPAASNAGELGDLENPWLSWVTYPEGSDPTGNVHPDQRLTSSTVVVDYNQESAGSTGEDVFTISHHQEDHLSVEGVVTHTVHDTSTFSSSEQTSRSSTIIHVDERISLGYYESGDIKSLTANTGFIYRTMNDLATASSSSASEDSTVGTTTTHHESTQTSSTGTVKQRSLSATGSTEISRNLATDIDMQEKHLGSSWEREVSEETYNSSYMTSQSASGSLVIESSRNGIEHGTAASGSNSDSLIWGFDNRGAIDITLNQSSHAESQRAGTFEQISNITSASTDGVNESSAFNTSSADGTFSGRSHSSTQKVSKQTINGVLFVTTVNATTSRDKTNGVYSHEGSYESGFQDDVASSSVQIIAHESNDYATNRWEKQVVTADGDSYDHVEMHVSQTRVLTATGSGHESTEYEEWGEFANRNHRETATDVGSETEIRTEFGSDFRSKSGLTQVRNFLEEPEGTPPEPGTVGSGPVHTLLQTGWAWVDQGGNPYLWMQRQSNSSRGERTLNYDLFSSLTVYADETWKKSTIESYQQDDISEGSSSTTTEQEISKSDDPDTRYKALVTHSSSATATDHNEEDKTHERGRDEAVITTHSTASTSLANGTILNDESKWYSIVVDTWSGPTETVRISSDVIGHSAETTFSLVIHAFTDQNGEARWGDATINTRTTEASYRAAVEDTTRSTIGEVNRVIDNVRESAGTKLGKVVDETFTSVTVVNQLIPTTTETSTETGYVSTYRSRSGFHLEHVVSQGTYGERTVDAYSNFTNDFEIGIWLGSGDAFSQSHIGSYNTVFIQEVGPGYEFLSSNEGQNDAWTSVSASTGYRSSGGTHKSLRNSWFKETNGGTVREGTDLEKAESWSAANRSTVDPSQAGTLFSTSKFSHEATLELTAPGFHSKDTLKEGIQSSSLSLLYDTTRELFSGFSIAVAHWTHDLDQTPEIILMEGVAMPMGMEVHEHSSGSITHLQWAEDAIFGERWSFTGPAIPETYMMVPNSVMAQPRLGEEELPDVVILAPLVLPDLEQLLAAAAEIPLIVAGDVLLSAADLLDGWFENAARTTFEFMVWSADRVDDLNLLARRIQKLSDDAGYHNVVAYFVGDYMLRPYFGDERLVPPASAWDNLKLATMAATEATRWVDPTGLSTIINQGLKISEKKWEDVTTRDLLMFAEGFVPVVGKGLGCSAATLLNGGLNLAQAGIGASEGIQHLREGRGDLALLDLFFVGLDLANAGTGYCFVAGTQVVVQIDADGTVSTHQASHDSYLGNVVLAGALLFVGVQGRRRLLRNRREDEESRMDAAFAGWANDELPPPPKCSTLTTDLPVADMCSDGSAESAVGRDSALTAHNGERDTSPKSATDGTHSLVEAAASTCPPETTAQAARRKPRTYLRPVLALTWLCAFLSLAGWFGYRVLPDNVTASAFAHETPVTPAKPRYITKNIEDVREGETVMAMDPATGRLRPKAVLQTFVRTANHLQLVTIEDSTGQSQTLQTTDEHPFWSADRKAWIVAEDLHPDERVLGPSGELQQIRDNRREEHPEGITVYNFEVDDFHSYFVASDVENLPLLVHNASKSDYGHLPNVKKWIKGGGRVIFHSDGSTKYVKNGLSVTYNPKRYPDFSRFLYKGDDGLNQVRIQLTKSRSLDEAAANAAAGFKFTPDGFTWHHHENLGLMQLVDEIVHGLFKHRGGFSLNH